jgi:hypothetical protein
LRRRRSVGEKLRLLIEILGIYVRARILLRSADLARCVAALRATGAEQTHSVSTWGEQVSAARLGKVVSKVLDPLPFDSRCLVRSLVLTTMLARRGISSSVVIGVRSEPEFGAHAWVESGGVALLPPGEYGRLVEV